MRFHKILNIFVIFLIIETCTAKPLNGNSPITSKQDLADYVLSNMKIMTKKYNDKYLELSPQLQKDESFELRDEAEILEFKANLNYFLENYDKNEKILLDFIQCVEFYLKIAEEQLTPEFKFIVELLEKYKFREVFEKYDKDVEEFLDDFKIKFEEIKINLDGPLLEWYEKFSSLTELDKQIVSFDKFFQLI